MAQRRKPFGNPFRKRSAARCLVQNKPRMLQLRLRLPGGHTELPETIPAFRLPARGRYS
ncbi:MAG: hypothetical protein JJU00_16300 [Opitutales bacterium]|nr:hypothetical protein [Opitutales bacterium]